MKPDVIVHLLLRFSDNLLENKDTIKEHNKIVDEYNAVWFGKMGAPVSSSIIDRLNKQVKDNIPTYIYLVKGNRKKPSVYFSQLLTATSVFPDKEKELIPKYYSDLEIIKYIKLWVKIRRIDSDISSSLGKMRAISSVYPIHETLVKSSSGHFIIRKNNFLF